MNSINRNSYKMLCLVGFRKRYFILSEKVLTPHKKYQIKEKTLQLSFKTSKLKPKTNDITYLKNSVA